MPGLKSGSWSSSSSSCTALRLRLGKGGRGVLFTAGDVPGGSRSETTSKSSASPSASLCSPEPCAAAANADHDRSIFRQPHKACDSGGLELGSIWPSTSDDWSLTTDILAAYLAIAALIIIMIGHLFLHLCPSSHVGLRVKGFRAWKA